MYAFVILNDLACQSAIDGRFDNFIPLSKTVMSTWTSFGAKPDLVNCCTVELSGALYWKCSAIQFQIPIFTRFAFFANEENAKDTIPRMLTTCLRLSTYTACHAPYTKYFLFQLLHLIFLFLTSTYQFVSGFLPLFYPFWLKCFYLYRMWLKDSVGGLSSVFIASCRAKTCF